MRRIIGWIGYSIVFVAVSVLVVQVAIYALDKQGRYDCERLLSQSKEFTGFFLSEYEKEKCDYLGVIIKAPIQ